MTKAKTAKKQEAEVLTEVLIDTPNRPTKVDGKNVEYVEIGNGLILQKFTQESKE